MRDKIIKGGFWLGASKISIQFFSFAINAVLAFFLKPESFGLISLVTVFLGVVSLFTNIGFGASIIQERNITKNQINTLYSINLITYLSTAIIVFFVSPFAASFYDSQELSPLIKLSSIGIALPSFYIIKRRLMEKRLEFNKLSIIDITSSVISGFAGIIAAFFGAEAYSLVIQVLILNLSYLVLINFYEKTKLEIAFFIKESKGLIISSFKFKISQTMNFLERNVDYMLIGKLFNTFTLGIYTFAFNIMYFPIKRISYVFTEVLFPSFSLIQNDFRKICTGFLKSIRIISIITFPMMLLTSFFCKDILHLFYGSKWNDAIPVIQILSVAGAIQSIEQISGVIFDAIKKTQINIFLGIIKIIFITFSVLIGSKYGLTGVATGITFYKFFTLIISFCLLKKEINLMFSDVLIYLKGPLIGSIVIIVILYFITTERAINENINAFVLLAFTLLVYIIIIVKFEKNSLKELYISFKTKKSEIK